MKALLVTALLAAPQADPIDVLLVTGANNHDWEWTHASLEAMLEEGGRFAVEVTTSPAETLARREALQRFDVFVLDYNGPRWGEVAEANFLDAVRGGTGVVVVHAANNAFRGWKEFEELVCLSWKPGHTGHGRFHEFSVRFEDRDHPITRTLPDFTAHPDELYHRLEHMHEAGFRVLGDALSTEASGGTGEREPMALVRDFGAGRVFHTPLGHVWRDRPETRASHEDPQFRNLIRRGTEWVATGEVRDGWRFANRLTALEEKAGWRLLFDGETLTGWRGVRSDELPAEGWEVRNGCIRHTRGGGDLVTTGSYENFELEFEWMVARGANSGVKVRFDEVRGIGPEYQVLDDAAHRDGANAEHSAGALYDVFEPAARLDRACGEWNRSRIVARGPRLEHWLNGERTVLCEVGSEAFEAARADSKFRGAEGFGSGAGPILLQDHGDEVWFRSLKIRDLDALPGEDVPLFEGGNGEGWRNNGDAQYELGDRQVRGTSSERGGHSFLISEATYGDFILECDLKLADSGNSGIQVRSHLVERTDKIYGYQIEIDPSDRRWSGGLYEEGRRGWLQNLESNPAGRAAFDRDGWNRYRIECIGPWIRTWVNGVPVTNYLDGMDLEGHFGLQVHGGKNTDLTWKNFRLRDLGKSSWTPLVTNTLLDSFESRSSAETFPAIVLSAESVETPPDLCLRARFRGDGWQLGFRGRGFDAAEQRVQRAPGLLEGATGWALDADSMRSAFKGEGMQEAILCAYGPRIVLHVNGERMGDVETTVAPPQGGFAFVRTRADAEFEFESLERLEHGP